MFNHLISLSVYILITCCSCSKVQEKSEVTDSENLSNGRITNPSEELVNVYLYDLLKTDREKFLHHLLDSSSSNVEKAKLIVYWLTNNLEWKATDYAVRSVDEIIERKGGNCNELSILTTELFSECEIKLRTVREINIHEHNVERQQRAKARIAQYGAKSSVFGLNHNDHVWLEILDERTRQWIPADPSLGVVGLDEWITARLTFDNRKSLNPRVSEMLIPAVIYAMDNDTYVDRSAYYLVEAFDNYYQKQLSSLRSWSTWVDNIALLASEGLTTFGGTNNFHDHQPEIDRLLRTYQLLHTQYEKNKKD